MISVQPIICTIETQICAYRPSAITCGYATACKPALNMLLNADFNADFNIISAPTAPCFVDSQTTTSTPRQLDML